MWKRNIVFVGLLGASSLAVPSDAFTLSSINGQKTHAARLSSINGEADIETVKLNELPSAETLKKMAQSKMKSGQPSMSKAIPFLQQPPLLTGELAGDVGFDPLRLATNKESLYAYREAEIKHARLAMLVS